MAENPRHDPDCSDNLSIDRDAPSGASTDGSRTLTAKIVEYPNSSNRCTIYPPGLTGIERMERWLSADASDFVDLEAWC